MAIHTELPIYRTGVQLLTLVVRAQEQMPRNVKRHMGDKIHAHCMEMLDEMALANATQRSERAGHIARVLLHQRATTVLLRVCFDSRWVAPKLWGELTQLLGSIGAQGGGWLKSATSPTATRPSNTGAPAA